MLNKLVFATIFIFMLFSFATAVPSDVQAQYGCTYHAYQRCVGNDLYWYDSCGTQQDLSQYCSGGCYNNICQNNYNYNYNYNYNNSANCTYHSYEQCIGNDLYWYNSCGQQQDYVGTCNGYNSYNYNYNYNNYRSCTYHAYKICQGNSVYWYDSCGTQQDLYYSCAAGQVCNSPGQYGQCTTYVQPIQPINNYVAHYKTACYNNSLYWYDSLGSASGLYKNCDDNNACTTDDCSSNKCSNTIKCDGSTCASGSADYNTYCQATQPTSQCGNGLCEPNLGETTTTCPNDCKINAGISGLSISLFIKQNSNSAQWQKTADMGSDSQAYFMISATNSSAVQIDNVNISANIPTDIASLGNLQLNGVPISGDIVSGINIGSIAPSSSKSITFEGKTQTITEDSTKQATATSNVSGAIQTDSASITLSPNQAGAISTAPAATGISAFLKRWYLWILGGVVLIFLFVFVFKRLSSND